MTKASRLVVLVLVLTAGGWAQSLFAVQVRGKQRWPGREADRLYLSACSVVQREFGAAQPVRPQFTLVLGADNNQALFDRREIRLTKWDAYLFAQGVALFAFEDLMSQDKILAIARRAVTWADSTVEIRATPNRQTMNSEATP
jgi:hypothetical protein